MAKILPILLYPDNNLHNICEDVNPQDLSIEEISLINNMLCTMRYNNGIGLAAPQVGVNKNIFVSDISYGEIVDKNNVYINPKIISYSEDLVEFEEGCLSLPGYFLKRNVRSNSIIIRYTNFFQEEIEEEVSGLKAICLQHEYDHLQGILFIDHLSKLKKDFARKTMENHIRRTIQNELMTRRKAL